MAAIAPRKGRETRHSTKARPSATTASPPSSPAISHSERARLSAAMAA